MIQGKKYMQNQKHSPLKIYHSCVDVRSGVSKRSGRPVFFIIKENWIWAMTRHHANNILLTRNLHFDSVKPSQ